MDGGSILTLLNCCTYVTVFFLTLALKYQCFKQQYRDTLQIPPFSFIFVLWIDFVHLTWERV